MNAPEKALIPSLRFPEFSGEWEESHIKDNAEVCTGSRDTQNRVDDGTYPFFVRSDTIERINTIGFEGEAVLTSGDGVGVGKNIHYINSKFDFHQRVYAIHSFTDKLNGRFFYHFFKEHFLKRVMRLSAKNSVDSVRMSMITDMPLSLPTPEEQQKIADYLGAVDAKLRLLERRRDALTACKKGMMQRIFAQEIRFTQDDGTAFPDWQEKRLGDVSNIYDGTHQTPKYVKTGIPFYSVEHLTADNFSDTKFISKEVFDHENKRVRLERNDILMTRIGSIGVSRIIDWDVSASFYVSLSLIKTDETVISSFIHQMIKSVDFQKELWRRTIHVAFPKKINVGEIGNCLINTPHPDEQQKIADFLSAIDSKITAATRRITAMQDFKKSMLQQMFV